MTYLPNEFADDRSYRPARFAPHPRRMADAGLDLRGMVDVLRRRFRLIAGITAAAIAAAALFLLLSPSFYTASTQLLIDPRDRRILETEVTAAGAGSDATLVESQLRIITSDAVIGRVVAALKLTDDPEFAGTVKLGAATSDDGLIRRARAISVLKKRVSVSRAERTYVIDVSASARTPHQAKTIADAIAAAYLADQIDANRLTTRQANEALASRLELLRADLRTAEDRVQSYRVANGIVGAQGNLVSEQQLTEINLRLVQARARVAEAQARFDQTRRPGADAGSAGEALASTVVTNLRTQLAEISRREAELSSTLGNRHPSLLEVRAQMSNVQRLIGGELHRISRSSANELAVARENEKALSNELDRLSGRSQSTDSSLIALRDLERDADVSRKLYEAFLTRAKQTAEQERIETAAARILAPAEMPLGSSYPPNVLLLVMALVFGLGIGATSAFLSEHLDDTVRSATQLRELTGLRVIVSGPERRKVTLARWLKLEQLLGHQAPPDGRGDDRSPPSAGAATAARALRHVLLEGTVRAEPRSVMVVSANDGEGAADFALNLALATSLTGKRVLIIDTDVEHRTLTKLIAPNAQTGIFDVIEGKLPLAGAAIANSDTGLNLLPIPAAAQASDKRVTPDQLSGLFAAAQADFDCIVVCGVPLLTEPDTGSLCRSVDQIVLVTRAGVSRREDVEDALQLLRIHHSRPHSVVLTAEAGGEIA